MTFIGTLTLDNLTFIGNLALDNFTFLGNLTLDNLTFIGNLTLDNLGDNLRSTKISFSLRMSLVNVSKFVVLCGFVHIY